MDEWRPHRKIKYNYSSLTTFEKGFDNGSVFLLARCVPNVKFYDLALNLKRLESEIDCGDWGFCLFFRIVISEGHKKGSFPNATVSNQNYLKLDFIRFLKKCLFSATSFKALSNFLHEGFYNFTINKVWRF